MEVEENKSYSHTFYRNAVEILNHHSLPFLVGGAFALREHTGVKRDTKDLDLFCKAGTYPKILKVFAAEGYKIELTDPRWIAKAFKDNFFIDFIFNTTNNLCPVDDSWFEHATEGDLFGIPVSFVAPEELLWCKMYVQDRKHYDGSDINHIILKKGKEMDWKRTYMRLEQHWHLLLAQFLNFQFVYPGEREMIPKWLFDELIELSKDQYDLPLPVDRICRGPLIDNSHYTSDILEGGYKIITVKNL